MGLKLGIIVRYIQHRLTETTHVYWTNILISCISTVLLCIVKTNILHVTVKSLKHYGNSRESFLYGDSTIFYLKYTYLSLFRKV